MGMFGREGWKKEEPSKGGKMGCLFLFLANGRYIVEVEVLEREKAEREGPMRQGGEGRTKAKTQARMMKIEKKQMRGRTSLKIYAKKYRSQFCSVLL